MWEFTSGLSKKTWVIIGELALKSLDFKTSKRVYQQILNEAGMYLTICRIEKIEDRNELLGHIAVIFEDFDPVPIFDPSCLAKFRHLSKLIRIAFRPSVDGVLSLFH
jgi:hypothetical protein